MTINYTMIKIAITGSIASGKSLIEKFLKQEGAVTLDTDRVVHELLENDKSVIKKVYELFNSLNIDVRLESGLIDRKKIGEVVFSDKQKLKELESILHPKVKKIVKEFLYQNQDKELLVISIPLLYEANMENIFDFVIAVIANKELRLKRLMKTRNLTEEEALKRIKAQDFGQEKLKKADFIIKNNGSIEDMQIEVKKILKKIIGD